ncbi:MAG: UDP-N-acetylmuramate dehydrogenase [Anaeroplasma sp.]
MKFEDFVISNSLGEIEKNRSFKELTTISTGGKINILFTPKGINELQIAYKYIMDNNLKYFIIGNGSNILASDRFFDGIVIQTKKLPQDIKYYENEIWVSAFYPTMKLAIDLAAKELGDLSFLGGIPGLLGGAIYNNSGSYGESIGDYLISVDYINTAGEINTISSLNCIFAYRRSIFHYIEGIIIGARIKVKKIKTKQILENRLKRRQESQPLQCKSMGSIFKNNPLIPSWKIIDALGLRGFQIGGAAVSSKHTNFIININDATSSDILSIIELIETRANLEFGIKMVKEITII